MSANNNNTLTLMLTVPPPPSTLGRWDYAENVANIKISHLQPPPSWLPVYSYSGSPVTQASIPVAHVQNTSTTAHQASNSDRSALATN